MSLIFSSTDRIDTGIAPVDVWAGFRWTYIAGPFKAPELGMSRYAGLSMLFVASAMVSASGVV